MEHLVSSIIRHVSEQMPDMSYVDEDFDQLANLDNEDEDMYPLTYPAVLVDLTEVDWSDMQGNNQTGEVKVRVRLALDCYDDTHAGSTTEWKSQERDRLRQRLDHLLMDFRPLGFGAMRREKSNFYTNGKGIKVYETHFACYTMELWKE